ncbi:hypothetical protein ENSA5_47800 [Enhygromyxa salina]|uniref:Lipoprotein n=1 Tax=Enhygromyxa salina TaxID=215803 RepID=A0A2S9XI94_9BACT|nr:hypothetical protein [Enhygromyxa salina]PRP92599.1 hypothetical protein ENSA5_47800 [Enhygromyxa salina]
MNKRHIYALAFALGLTTRFLTACAEGSQGDCQPGELGCECIGGTLCTDGSTCDLGLCVGGSAESGDETAGEESGGAEMGDGDTSGDGDLSCEISADCLDDEVCVEGACGDTDLYYYDASVVVFVPPICRDGVGTAELEYEVYQDEVFTDLSSEAGCPGAWPQEPFSYDSLSTLQLDFYEVDAFFDDYITSMCWTDEFDQCDRVPKLILHDGGWVGMVEESYIELRFDPLPY